VPAFAASDSGLCSSHSGGDPYDRSSLKTVNDIISQSFSPFFDWADVIVDVFGDASKIPGGLLALAHDAISYLQDHYDGSHFWFVLDYLISTNSAYSLFAGASTPSYNTSFLRLCEIAAGVSIDFADRPNLFERYSNNRYDGEAGRMFFVRDFCLSLCYLGQWCSFDTRVVYDELAGVHRVMIDYDVSGFLSSGSGSFYLVDSNGYFPYFCEDCATGSTGSGSTIVNIDALGGNWQPLKDVQNNDLKVFQSLDVFSGLQGALQPLGQDSEVQLRSFSGAPAFCLTRQDPAQDSDEIWVFCDKYARPFVVFPPDQKDDWAANTEQDHYTEEDESGKITEGETVSTQIIDQTSSIVTVPGVEFSFVDELIYSPENKTYYVTSHTTNQVTYNYEITYHINYTSVTYIGQTEQYDEEYEFYYRLPDGRSSADLTVEELEQLNTQIDVVEYSRTADELDLQSLYHFDGNTRDSSYWSYATGFTWHKGASLTYMDAGAFNGALYLDENEHRFSLQLPSALYYNDFTLQFRIYQSHTLTPAEDSSVSMAYDGGWIDLLSLSGAEILSGTGRSFSSMPVGTWNEICIMRKDEAFYFFLNGVLIGENSSGDYSFEDEISFAFGSEQQTYKYLDEFRFLTSAIYEPSGYEPTAVPHDTNLALVLPDSAVAVADQYWTFTGEDNNLLDVTGETFTSSPDLYEFSTCFASGYGEDDPPTNSWFFHDDTCLEENSYVYAYRHINFTRLVFEGAGVLQLNVDGDAAAYTASIVFRDGFVLSASTADVDESIGYAELSYGNFSLKVESCWNGFLFTFAPAEVSMSNTCDIVYMELIEGTSTDLKAEFVSAVVPMDAGSFESVTLAVRTDLKIMSYQLGGVRPSVPYKGMVWALIESGRITSLQIYGGTAWESVDGRIWTGERWIPYGSYNVVTMKDLYDVIDGSGSDWEYIYTQNGFWSWLQRSWQTMIEKLDAILQAIKTGGTVSNVDLSETPDVDGNGVADETNVIDATKTVFKGLWDLVVFFFNGVSGVFADLGDTLTEATKSINQKDSNGAFGFFYGDPEWGNPDALSSGT